MRKIFHLAIREYKASVKTKGFIIGLIVAPIFMGGSMIAFALLRDRVDTTDKTLAVLDRTGRMAAALVEAAQERNAKEIRDPQTGKKTKPAYFIETVEPDSVKADAQRLALSDKVREGRYHAFMEIGPDAVHPAQNPETSRINYYAKNATMDDLRRWISWPVNDHLRKLRLADAGIEGSKVQDLFYWVNVDGLGLVTVDEGTGGIQDARRATEAEAIFVPIIMVMFMFLMIMMNVPGMLQAVMEEKTQCIAEVLLGSVTPFEFMMGKLLSGVAVSLTSAAVYVCCGTLAARQMGYHAYIPFHVLPWFLAYMLLGIVLFGSMAAALGAACSEPKDSQTLTFPCIVPVIFPMFIYFPVLKEPLSRFATVTSLIPPFTPVLMVVRMATPEHIPAWQPAAGLVGMVVFTVLSVWAGGRIFRVAILMQGTPPKLSNILRWVASG